jgi:D-alanine-D-alanine ligase
MRIAVLMGGTNFDRDTSLVSGWQVAQALREVGHETIAVDTTMPVSRLDGVAFADLGETQEVPPIRVEPPTMAELRRLRERAGGHILAPGVLEVCQAADCVFVALFGDEGEGGKAQAILDYAGVTYTGPDTLGCAVSFDKDVAKRLVSSTGVATAPWSTVPQGEEAFGDVEYLLPAVVKPVAGGSSIGASVARTPEELARAIATAHATAQDALVERLVPGREFTVGVLRGRALPAVELQAGRDLIDYESKYQPGITTKQCPAPLGDQEAEELADAAVTAHHQLKLGPKTCSRMDFRMDEEGRFHFLECNPLPGMTPSSFLPVAAAADNIEFPKLCDEIVSLAMETLSPGQDPRALARDGT